MSESEQGYEGRWVTCPKCDEKGKLVRRSRTHTKSEYWQIRHNDHYCYVGKSLPTVLLVQLGRRLKVNDAWASLREQREARIKEITEWIKDQFFEILRQLREKEFLDKKKGAYLKFDEMSEWRQQWEFGKAVYQALKTKIVKDYHVSGKTLKEYVEVIMLNLGCKEGYDAYRNRYWLCPF